VNNGVKNSKNMVIFGLKCLKVAEIQTVSDDFQTNSDTQARIKPHFQTIQTSEFLPSFF
jgi:hypothetical protein